MIIQLPEWKDWRISGEKLDWQIQELAKDKTKEGGTRWKATNFFPTLEAAIGHAYERTLRESPKSIAMIREVHIECERTKSHMLKAVKKAVAS